MTPPRFTDMIGHALRLKCPCCGQGKLYQRYLKPVDQCSHCQVAWCQYRADDGPAWVTILILGHVMTSAAVTLAMTTQWPVWQILSLLTAAAGVLTLMMLPFSKAVFMAAIWHSQHAHISPPDSQA